MRVFLIIILCVSFNLVHAETNDPAKTFSDSENRAFITQLYKEYTGRKPDFIGMQNALNSLHQGSTYEELAKDFKHSPEAARYYVQNLYRTLLGREADPVGLNTFVNMIVNGTTYEEVKSAIINSEEYKKKQR